MNILHIIPTLGCGGAEILVSNLAIQQVKSGHTVKIVILEPYHQTFDNFISKEELLQIVSIERVTTKIHFFFLKGKIELSNNEFDDIVKIFSPNIIHSHLFQAELLARYTIYDNVKYFSHCHNNMSQFLFLQKGLSFKRKITDFLERKWLEKRYIKCSNNFITISKDTTSFFKRKLPLILRNRIHFVPNAINKSLFFLNEHKETSVIKLISIGNLLENKGHSFLIDVIYLIKKAGFEVKLNILGYGNQYENLKYKIDSLGLSDEVLLRGSVSNVNEYLSNSDICIHGAFKEAFGLVLIEAMASEIPVISTSGGGNDELFIDGYNGYLILNRDINVFVEKVIYMIKNPTQRKIMGRNAKTFSKNYDIIPYTETILNLYEKM
jgi:glycosyltransferase involved in cell wall biosynthesis